MYAPHRYLFPPIVPFHRRKTLPGQSSYVESMDSGGFTRSQVITIGSIRQLEDVDLIRLTADLGCYSCKSHEIRRIDVSLPRWRSRLCDALCIDAATPSIRLVPRVLVFCESNATSVSRTLPDVVASSDARKGAKHENDIPTAASTGGI